MQNEQLQIFRELFRGREDVYPVGWKNKKSESGYSPKCSNRFDNGLCNHRCDDCVNKKFEPLTDIVIKRHLSGLDLIGVYPLLPDNTCYFIAADFDNHAGEKNPLDDVRAFSEVCHCQDIPVLIERSKSGNGYHAWGFFDKAIPAWKARVVWAAIAREAQLIDDGSSFDRLFPNQDELSGKGLGNLIALPLYGKAFKQGNSTFLDENFKPITNYKAIWPYLRNVQRISRGALDNIIGNWGLTRQAQEYTVGKVTFDDWGKNITKGERNNTLARMAGSLLTKMSAEDALPMLKAWNNDHCYPPLPEIEVIKIVKSIAQKEARKEPVKVNIEQSVSSPTQAQQEEEKPKKSMAVRLVEMVISDSTIILFHNEKKAGYFRRGNEILPLRSRAFKNYLRKLLWEREGKTCGEDVLKAAIGVLEAKAIYDFPEHVLDVRVTKRDGKYYYDLRSGGVVCCEKGKPWKILTEKPILFRSFTHQKEQVLPQGPGDLKKILQFINFKKEDTPDGKLSKNQLLFLCYLVSCLLPDIPHPIIIVIGEQGAGKSTLFRVSKPLIDPSHVLTISNPGDFKEFVQIADHHYVLYLDNLTQLSDWTSDALCRFCTGEGFSKRELFSDDEDIFYAFRRCVGLNGINLVASRADLLDRSLIFNLERIPDNERKHEQHFYAEFERALPFILHGLFDIFSAALNYVDDIKLTSKPRMADFAIWGCAISRALGYRDQDFLDAYYQNIHLQNEEALDASPIAKAIIAYMENKPMVEVMETSSDLLAALKVKAEEEKIDTRSDLWPKAANWLWKRIKEVKPNLQSIGIKATKGKGKNSNYITLYREKNTSDASTASTDKQNQLDTYGSKGGSIFDKKNASTNTSEDNLLKDKDGGSIGSSGGIFPSLRGDELMEGEI